MATTTNKYGLTKPDAADYYDIDIFNSNADKIEDALTTVDAADAGITSLAAFISALTSGKTLGKTLGNLKAALAFVLHKGQVANNLTTEDEGYVLDARQGKALDAAKAPVSHAAAGTTYGAGNASKYGHVKVSDSLASSSKAADGVAASPYAVKQSYDLASLSVKTWSVSLPVSGWSSAYPYTQTVVVSGMAASYSPVWAVLNTATTEANAKAISKAAGFLQSITTADGAITVKAIKKPTVALTLSGKGV